VGFYVLALAIVVALLGICYLMIFAAERVSVQLLLICVVSAGAILWSLVPRIDRFVAPGPRLLPSEHPRLFREIEQIAAATGQKMPAEVYLEGELNAWVGQRGGIMGIGSRRVMGLGLPLMRVLNVDELRAVLAHEFGHYHGGDTRLGPLVHKTHSAIGRTIMNLDGGLLQKPFLWYGSLFLRITHAVSRHQEFTADRLAAQTVGREPLVSGLQKIHSSAMAFTVFWQSEMVPVLSAGFRAPIADGFARFLGAANIAALVEQQLKEELQGGQADPYDTHPPLAQRIAAVHDAAAWQRPQDAAPAVALLEDVPRLERGVLAAIAGDAAVAELADTDWDAAGPTVYIPLWRKAVAEGCNDLAGLRPETLPQTLARDLAAAGDEPPEDLQRRLALAGMAVALAALEAGAALDCRVGMPVAVLRDDLRVEPFAVIPQLASGGLTSSSWLTQCEGLGITGVELSTVAAGMAAASA
jgi:heat shock protein HtpX